MPPEGSSNPKRKVQALILTLQDRAIDYGFMDLFSSAETKTTLRAIPVLGFPHFDILVFVSPGGAAGRPSRK